MKCNNLCKFASEKKDMTPTVTEAKIHRLESMLEAASKVSVVTHTRPDGDAIGSTSAMVCLLRGLGKDAMLLLPDGYPDNLAFVTGETCEGHIMRCDRDPDAVKARIAGSDLVIGMDLSGFDRAEGMQEALQASRAAKLLIDHHIDPQEKDFDLVFSQTEISSTCELLYYILIATKWAGGDASKLPMPALRALMTGMTTDTNNFANSVFPSTFEMASRLLEAGVDRDGILSELYNRFRENRLRMTGHLVKDNMRILPSGVSYIVVRRSELEEYDIRDGETEGIVNMPLTLDKVRMSIFLREDDGFFRVSIRSKRGTSAFRLASTRFHGGGHEQAAGGRLYFPGDIADASMAEEFIERVTEDYFKTEDEN